MPRKQKAAKAILDASNVDHSAAADAAHHTAEADDNLPADAGLPRRASAVPHASGLASERVSQDRLRFADPLATDTGDVDQRNVAAPTLGVPSPVTQSLAEIRAWHRQRVFAMEQRKRADLALGAFLRTSLGWSRALPKAEAEKIRKRAANLILLGEKVFKGKETAIGDTDFAQFGVVIMAAIQGRSHWDAIESSATKEMERLAKSLPVWAAFGEPIKGFGSRSLAVILAETGDLSNYANPAKVWKRMGLAVMDGVRQGGLRKSAGADEWIAHGYSAKRRSFMFVIGDVLVKNQNPYRELYLTRKSIERAKAEALGLTVVPAAKIPVKRKHEFMSDGHVHRRAQRYMEKRLLKDLWQAWRQTTSFLTPNNTMSAA
jgi:hypothetical protein